MKTRKLLAVQLALFVFSICVTACQVPSSESLGVSATILAIEGIVSARINPSTDYVEAEVNDILSGGDSLRTGDESWGTLSLDNDTVMVVSPNADLTIDMLEGTPESPIVRMTLNAGEVFNIRSGQIGEEGDYEITTPAGVTSIRGTGMSASHDLDTDSGESTCLFGTCGVTAGGANVDLVGNQYVRVDTTQGIIGQPEPLMQDQLDRWSIAFEKASAAGLGQAADAVCDCQNGTDLVCDDGTVIEDFPACSAGILSTSSNVVPTQDIAQQLQDVSAWAGIVTVTDVYEETFVEEYVEYRDLGGSTSGDYTVRNEYNGGTTLQGSIRYDLVSSGSWRASEGEIDWTETYSSYNQQWAPWGDKVYDLLCTITGSGQLIPDSEQTLITINEEAETYDLTFVPAGLADLTTSVSCQRTDIDTGEPDAQPLPLFPEDGENPAAASGYTGRAIGIPLPEGDLVLEGTYTMEDGTVMTWQLTPVAE